MDKDNVGHSKKLRLTLIFTKLGPKKAMSKFSNKELYITLVDWDVEGWSWLLDCINSLNASSRAFNRSLSIFFSSSSSFLLEDTSSNSLGLTLPPHKRTWFLTWEPKQVSIISRSNISGFDWMVWTSWSYKTCSWYNLIHIKYNWV